MATRAAPRARLSTDRKFFTGIAAALLAATFVGFAPTYYLRGLSGAAPLGPLVHLHGALYTAWMLLFLIQAGLVAGGRTNIHRAVGLTSTGLWAAIIPLGLIVAVESARLGHGPPDRNQPVFLAFPFTIMLLFTLFGALAIARRNRPEAHKRLMLLATISLVMPALARIPRWVHWVPLPEGPTGGMILSNLFLAALVLFDLATRRRLHPVTLWGGGFLLVSEPLRVMVGRSEAWQAFARTLIG